MKTHPKFALCWRLANAAVVGSLVLLVYGLVWEYSTRKYLQGFTDAIVPAAATPEEKVESILHWMREGAGRQAAPEGQFASRDPRDTLNYQELLRVCGSATNAFINLAVASGVDARRLLLLGEDRGAKHVVAEARLNGRWAVVDPLYRAMLRDASGRPLSKEELRDPAVLKQATAGIPGYSPLYTYDSTAHVRISALPVVGRPLRRFLDWALPGWDSAVNWSLLLERSSLFFTLAAGAFLVATLLLRFLLGRYGERRLQISRVRLRDQVVRVYEILFRSPG
jgi:hypothetical protein